MTVTAAEFGVQADEGLNFADVNILSRTHR
jgi:hypothetical protein